LRWFIKGKTGNEIVDQTGSRLFPLLTLGVLVSEFSCCLFSQVKKKMTAEYSLYFFFGRAKTVPLIQEWTL
jgi:hypothetical protein